jgi:4-aminobutyrate aminotransferase/(S)-3-amino-2-methylpropionate transaminase
MFREPFAGRLPAATHFARFGDLASVAAVAAAAPEPPGAVLVEPIQGRGGDRIPPEGFLSGLRALCDREGWLLICDEIFTGFGRTGRWFACEHEDVVPDLLCVGKGMASGMPISACIGRASVMDAWPPSGGEALHTQTFLGHPPGCAAALAAMAVIEEEGLVEASARHGAAALRELRERLAGHAAVGDVRGRGLMIAVECVDAAAAQRACRGALERGFITLPSGDAGNVLSITPPLCIEPASLALAAAAIGEALA